MLDFSKISDLRKIKRLSQRELAKKSNLSHGYIGLLESGRKNNPSIGVLVNISAALEMEIDKFIKKLKEK